MRMAVNSHALPSYKKNRIASLKCIFEAIIQADIRSIYYYLSFFYQNMHVFEILIEREVFFTIQHAIIRPNKIYVWYRLHPEKK